MVGKMSGLSLKGKEVWLQTMKSKSESLPDVDSNGVILIKDSVGVGTRAETIFKRADGSIVPKSEVKKLMTMPDGSTRVMSRVKKTDKVEKYDVMSQAQANELMSKYIEVSIQYRVNTTDKQILKEIIDEKKAYRFPFCTGGFTGIYGAILIELSGSIVIKLYRYNAEKILSQSVIDEEIEIVDNGLTQEDMTLLID